jgi:broad specificity phosphatase PhoE
MGLVYFVTHPEVVIDPAVPVPLWSLSQRGRERMERLLAQPWVGGVSAIYCSAEQKAIDGAGILARHLGLGYEQVEALGEVDRSSTGYLPHEEHQALAELLFAHPDHSIRGWETARDAQRRIVAAVERILAEDAGQGHMAIVSHGGAGALYLCHLKGVEISRSEDQPGGGGGCYYCFEAGTRSLVHGWKLIDAIDPNAPAQDGP